MCPNTYTHDNLLQIIQENFEGIIQNWKSQQNSRIECTSFGWSVIYMNYGTCKHLSLVRCVSQEKIVKNQGLFSACKKHGP